MSYTYGFERLEVWQNARKLVTSIYSLTKEFPKEERFGLVDQLGRAVISVTANIAEGSSRLSAKDQAHFSNLAYGSLMEVWHKRVEKGDLL